MKNKNKKEIETEIENENIEKKEKLDQFFKKEYELKTLLDKTIEISEKNQKDIKYIKHFVIWIQIWGAIKVCLILIPIILGILYLPPFLKQWVGMYQGLLLDDGSGKNVSENLILENIIPQ